MSKTQQQYKKMDTKPRFEHTKLGVFVVVLVCVICALAIILPAVLIKGEPVAKGPAPAPSPDRVQRK